MEGDLRIAKNCWTAKVYNALLLSYSQPEENSYKKAEWLLEKSIYDVTDSDNHLNYWKGMYK